MAQKLWHDDNVEMRPRRPCRQVRAVDRGKLVLGDVRRHPFDLGHLDPDDRGVTWHFVFVDVAGVALRNLGLVLVGRDHGLVGFDPGLPIHRERIGPRWRGKRGGIDGKGLILVPQIKVLLQGPPVHWMG